MKAVKKGQPCVMSPPPLGADLDDRQQARGQGRQEEQDEGIDAEDGEWDRPSPPLANLDDPVARRQSDQGEAAREHIAERAASDATTLTPTEAATRFTECAGILRATPMSKETVISYPVVGSATLAVVAEVALMEATVHLLDLADAVGGVRPSEQALAATRDLLIAIPDPIAAIEVLAGRADPASAVHAIR